MAFCYSQCLVVFYATKEFETNFHEKNTDFCELILLKCPEVKPSAEVE